MRAEKKVKPGPTRRQWGLTNFIILQGDHSMQGMEEGPTWPLLAWRMRGAVLPWSEALVSSRGPWGRASYYNHHFSKAGCC